MFAISLVPLIVIFYFYFISNTPVEDITSVIMCITMFIIFIGFTLLGAFFLGIGGAMLIFFLQRYVDGTLFLMVASTILGVISLCAFIALINTLNRNGKIQKRDDYFAQEVKPIKDRIRQGLIDEWGSVLTIEDMGLEDKGERS